MAYQLGGLDAYSHDLWEKLPEDKVAFSRQRQSPVEDRIFEEIGSIFIKNGVNDNFLLYLNHRHFLLEPGEGVVEYGKVTTPWQLEGSDADMVRDGILGKTWAFFGDKLLPTEFSYLPGASPQSSATAPSGFVEELGGYLREHGLSDRFGITLNSPAKPGDGIDTYETTVGRVSLQVPREAQPGDNMVEVAWSFNHDGRKVIFLCKNCCKYHA